MELNRRLKLSLKLENINPALKRSTSPLHLIRYYNSKTLRLCERQLSRPQLNLRANRDFGIRLRRDNRKLRHVCVRVDHRCTFFRAASRFDDALQSGESQHLNMLFDACLASLTQHRSVMDRSSQFRAGGVPKKISGSGMHMAGELSTNIPHELEAATQYPY